MEGPGRDDLIGASAAREAASDYVSRHLVREILDEIEERIDLLETQFEPIEKIRLQNHPRSAV
ncbi:MAG: hypothetical protein IPK81_16565 [Rhodospirillales bacterium]|nr:MAG: hypothetical protein IPK81_16565 [Rhodospirillales bacterium]